ncbi:hypothetical protein DEO72_LG8g2252 [Vigna unguiculata]|uniref:Uncharacterized protein n=1 Tax=Vigna unguiculata TaxID=3917 RepID=A0A4D6MT12_VIGUN|nr:hypothetical protein DEO72_LG8g2252 [Vigna unguiculata]
MYEVVKKQEFWFTSVITILIIIPWLSVTKVEVYVTAPSSHASSMRFEGGVKAGDERSKMPLSLKITDSQQSPFGLGHGLDDKNDDIELMESSSYPSASNVSHSYSSNSLGEMQFESSNMGAFWSSYKSQMHLQSRLSQSQEDLNSSLVEVHLVKS